jgi:ribosomal protein L40E
MALKPCRECGQEVSTDAKSCPHCGTKHPTGKRKPLGCGMLILVIVLGGIAASVFDTGGPSESERSEDRRERDLRFYGVIACENAVRNALISPSTARFQGGTNHGVVLADSIVRVRSWVDSQNRMGATLRSTFTCEAVNTDADVRDGWRIVDLEIQSP